MSAISHDLCQSVSKTWIRRLKLYLHRQREAEMLDEKRKISVKHSGYKADLEHMGLYTAMPFFLSAISYPLSSFSGK